MRALLFVAVLLALTGCAAPGSRGNADFSPNLAVTFSLINTRGQVGSSSVKDHGQAKTDADLQSEGGAAARGAATE